MKKILSIAFAATFLLSSTSCKDFLETSSPSVVDRILYSQTKLQLDQHYIMDMNRYIILEVFILTVSFGIRYGGLI